VRGQKEKRKREELPGESKQGLNSGFKKSDKKREKVWSESGKKSGKV
jgi:hypothetical protein